MNSPTITLFSTSGCHLCEMALSLVEQCNMSLPVEVIDIAFDDALFPRYGVTIPVLKYGKSEINWPFDLQQLQQWLDNNGITYDS